MMPNAFLGVWSLGIDHYEHWSRSEKAQACDEEYSNCGASYAR